MPLVVARCTNCGVILKVDSTKDAAICECCNTPFIVEKAINNYNTTNQITGSAVNTYGGNPVDFLIQGGILEKYKGASTKVVIPNNVKEIGIKAFKNCEDLTSVTIPDSVTSIGDFAFDGCTFLTSIMIPNSVTSIGDYAFNDCWGLTSITIPTSVTSIGDSTFDHCIGLENITIPNSVTSIGNWAFADCTDLTSITIPSRVTSIGDYAFNKCTGLTSITIPDSVTRIGKNAFSGCTCLTSITIPSSVRSIEKDAFSGCTGLISVTIPNSVTSIGELAFAHCEGLTNVTIGNSVTSIGKFAFSLCLSLKDVYYFGTQKQWNEIEIGEFNESLSMATIHYSTKDLTGSSPISTCPEYGEKEDSSEYDVVSSDHRNSGNDIFVMKENTIIRYCGNTTNVVVPNYIENIAEKAFLNHKEITSISIPSSIKNIAPNAFSGCTGIKSLNNIDDVLCISAVHFVDSELYRSKDNWIDGALYVNNTLLCVDSTLTGTLSVKHGTEVICGRAFAGCKQLTKIAMPNSVIHIGTEAFSNCTGLAEVILSNNVEKIGTRLFEGCTSLTNIIIPESVKAIGTSSFEGCISLTEINIPNSIEDISLYAFKGCTCLKKVVLSNKLKKIGIETFGGCTSLTNIIIPDGVKEISTSTFEGCFRLTSITIPHSVTEIGIRAFYGCTKLKEVKMYDGLIKIEGSAFANCICLEELVIPSTVTHIGSVAFSNCKNLSKLVIPNDLISLGALAFKDCTGLTEVTLPDRAAILIANSFIIELDNVVSLTITGNNYFDSSDITEVVRKLGLNCNYLTLVECPQSWFDAFVNINISCVRVYGIKRPQLVDSEPKTENTTYNNSKKAEGCYIATAVYSSYNCPQVWTLRRFRDGTLAHTWYGRLFISVYYAVSPRIVALFGETAWFNRLFRKRLDRLVSRLNNEGVADTPYND